VRKQDRCRGEKSQDNTFENKRDLLLKTLFWIWKWSSKTCLETLKKNSRK